MTGLIVKHTGSNYTVRSNCGQLYLSTVRGKLRLKDMKTTNPIAVGDKVVFSVTSADRGVITDIKPRKNYIIQKSANLSRQAHILAANIDRIKAEIPERISLFSGNSGAGKSAIMNSLSSDLNLKTGEISKAHNKGMHTTTFYEMFEIDSGFVIDPPGIKGFGLISFLPRNFQSIIRMQVQDMQPHSRAGIRGESSRRSGRNQRKPLYGLSENTRRKR